MSETDDIAVPATQGPEIIRNLVKLLPNRPGVYRMFDAKGDVIYVGKARNLKNRVSNYTRFGGHTNRIAAMIASTCNMEFVTTATEAEALLLEANLIKKLKPRYNVTPARRQVVSLYPDRQGPCRRADRQASRRAQSQGQLFRAVCLGGCGQPDDQHAAEGVPLTLLQRQRVRATARGPACCTRSSAARRPASG